MSSNKSKSVSFSIVSYDIPSYCGIDNPTLDFLRLRGTRYQFSNWIFFSDEVPYAYLDSIRQTLAQTHPEALHRLRLDVIKQDPSEVERFRKEFLPRSLLQDIQSAEESLTKTLDALDAKQREEEESGTDNETKRKYRQSRREQAIKLHTEKLEAIHASAEHLGIDLSNVPFETARQRLNALRSVSGNRMRLAGELASVLKGTAMEAAIRDASVPLPIAADYAEEVNPQNVPLSNAVRDAFENAPATGNPVQELRSALNVPPQQNPGREYRVRTRDGYRSVHSHYTNAEAAQTCAVLGDSFARDLASRFRRGARLSPLQIAWMHVLAIESEQAQSPAPSAPPVPQQSAAQKTNPTPPVAPSAPQNANPSVPAPSVDDTVPGEKKTDVPEMTTGGSMSYDSASRTLIIDHSETPLRGYPPVVNVRSHKTDVVQSFSFHEEEWTGDEMTSVLYRSLDKKTFLRIVND